ncbi:hypothetical protein CHS0354_034480 [Potamilus streckersoni]|uniref:Ureidoglycolate hydrolase n=1 Tax=Potamilus streckersoni TaxID=2493646 RepID=A0AAE0T2V1_9BIVA|nr:hypothetical protein CHS0354_034480 [Potamilus streckersoni]
MDLSRDSLMTVSKTDKFWNPGFLDEDITRCGEPVKVPYVVASEKTLHGYGTIIHDFDQAEVEVLPYPVKGWRPLCPGTGIQGEIRRGDFKYQWVQDLCVARNLAVNWGYMVTGRLQDGVAPQKRTRVLVREANYHPDGGQAFYPCNKEPFIAVLALPTDDVKPEHFKAFYFGGTFGVNLYPNVWHQPLYPITNEAVYRTKQAATYACVSVDTVDEFAKFLSVPLLPNA